MNKLLRLLLAPLVLITSLIVAALLFALLILVIVIIIPVSAIVLLWICIKTTGDYIGLVINGIEYEYEDEVE